jgi:hypothetical protein
LCAGAFQFHRANEKQAVKLRLSFLERKEQNIVTALCDSGHKYQSTLFNRDWLASNHLDPNLPLELILDG